MSDANIVVVQPIFVPDARRFDRNVSSIRSLGSVLDGNNSIGGIILGGWGVEPFLSEIQSIAKTVLSDKCTLSNHFERNYGKAHVVNKLVDDNKTSIEKFDYMLLADSDILFDKSRPDIIDIAGATVKSYELFTNKPAGFVAFNQTYQNCHILSELNIRIDVELQNKSRETILSSENPSGLAGGCLITCPKIWNEVGGYREFGVYAGDDAHYLLDAANVGACYGVMENISVGHPPDTDQDYIKWKLQSVRQFQSQTSSSIDSSREHADYFWDRRHRKTLDE